jgi:hypothetical protein
MGVELDQATMTNMRLERNSFVFPSCPWWLLFSRLYPVFFRVLCG